MDLRGRRLGEYLVGEPIADGMWRAGGPDQREVILSARAATDAAEAQRRLDAARAAAAVEAPAIAPLVASGAEEDHVVWLASERGEGTPLDELLRAQGPLPAPRFVPLFEQVCGAVALAHAQGVAHGDLRPERVIVSAHDGELVPSIGGFGAGFGDGSAADDVSALVALARDALDGGARVVTEELAAQCGGAAEVAAAVRSAAGLDPAAELPRLDEVLHAQLLASAPQPVAEAIAALDAAVDDETALEAAREVAGVLARYLAALALAARGHTPASLKADPSEATAALRALRSRTLEDGEWLTVARDLCRAFAGRAELHPVPALCTYLLHEAEPLERLLDAEELAPAMADLAVTLGSMQFLVDHRLVVPHGDRGEVWMGIRRGRPLTIPLPSPLPEGWPVILDPSGQPALALYPVVQVAEPAPGQPAEVFLLAGPGRHGARLEALPSGAILEDEKLWGWFGENLFALSGQVPAVGVQGPPWRGLAPYGPEHAPAFFGREREAQALVNRLRVEPLVIVAGAVGAGKTSLVQAGVIPSLPLDWRAITVRPGDAPLGALAAAVGRKRAELGANPDGLARALRAAAGDGTALLVVDPLEELFTRCADDVERGQAALALARAARSAADRVRVLLVARDDFLVALEALLPFRERVARGLHLCVTPTAEQLLRVVIDPALRSGHPVDDSATAEALAAEAAALPAGLAHLSLLLARLWERRGDGELPLAAAPSLGGVGGALANHVEQALARLSPEERAVVPDLVRGGVAGELADLAERLCAAGLLRTDGARVEPAHEVLRPLLDRRREAPAPAPPAARAPRWPLLLGGAALLLALLAVVAGRRAPAPAGDPALTAALVERGRRTLLAGDARAALSDLREAGRRGAGGAPYRLLLARAETAAQPERLLLPHPGKVWMVGYSADGRRLVTAADDQQARIWDPATGSLVATLSGHTGTVWSARFSADGARVITGSDDGTARIWDARAASTLQTLVGHRGAILDAVLAGERAVTLGLDGTIRVFNNSGAALHVLEAGAGSFAVAPAGDRVAAGGSDGTTRVYDLAGGKPLATLPGHRAAVLGVSFGRGGALLCTASADRSVRVWDADGGGLRWEGKHGGDVTGCAFSPDGALVASSSADHSAKVWDVASGALLYTLDHRGEVSRALFSPDGRLLATASSDATARLWDAATGRARGALVGHEDGIFWVAFGPGAGEVATAGLDGTARIWAAARDPLLVTLVGHADAVLSARFSPDGTRVVTASRDDTARVWDASSGAQLAVLPHDDAVRSAELSPDGTRVLTASKDGRARVFPVAGGAPLLVIEAGAPLATARFGPRGDRIVTAAEHGAVKVWSADSGAPLATLPVAEAADASFAPDGRLVVAVPLGATIFGADGALLARLTGHRLDVHTAAFSPDGARVVTAAADRTARVFDAGRGDLLAVLSGNAQELMQAEFSPSGELVLTAGGDFTARLWDARGGALLDVLEGHTDWVYAAAFSADGGRVVTASGDRTARIWETRLHGADR